MSKYSQDRNYIYYENSNIPRNKLNIRNQKILEEKERELLFKGYEYFHKTLSEKTNFNENYFKELHRYSFIELYDFAGEYRKLNISKGYTTFCQARFLAQTSKEIFRKLASDNFLKNYSDEPKEKFAAKIAYYMCELIALHPFYEINGRIIRLFFDMIAVYNGYEYIDYEKALKSENDKNKYIAASIDCMTSNDDKMHQIVLEGLNTSI